MGKYVAVTALSLPNPLAPDKPERSLLHRAGSVVELDDETAKTCLDAGIVRELDQPAPDSEEAGSQAGPDLAELAAQRPGANASKDEWRAYAERVGVDMTALSADAKRDELVAAVDVRIAHLQAQSSA